MTKRTTYIIMAAISAALLFGGILVFLKDDILQNRINEDILRYEPVPDIHQELDEITANLISEITTQSKYNFESTETTASIYYHESEIDTSTLPENVWQDLVETVQTLNNTYPNALGWLYIPNTAINYPVMQGNDNDFYLSHAYDDSPLNAGSIFLDYRCESRFMNPVNILYGHNMKNGSMFAGIPRFANENYFNSHRYGWLATSETVYRIDFFSCAIADRYNSLYDGSTPISEWVPSICDMSAVNQEFSYSDKDRFISLSTCSYEFKNARTILTGKLVEMNGG